MTGIFDFNIQILIIMIHKVSRNFQAYAPGICKRNVLSIYKAPEATAYLMTQR